MTTITDLPDDAMKVIISFLPPGFYTVINSVNSKFRSLVTTLDRKFPLIDIIVNVVKEQNTALCEFFFKIGFDDKIDQWCHGAALTGSLNMLKYLMTKG